MGLFKTSIDDLLKKIISQGNSEYTKLVEKIVKRHHEVFNEDNVATATNFILEKLQNALNNEYKLTKYGYKIEMQFVIIPTTIPTEKLSLDDESQEHEHKIPDKQNKFEFILKE